MRTSRSVASSPASKHGATSIRRSRHAATHGVVCAQNPARMTPTARMRELGAILAAGFLRQLENRSNSLDDRAQVERACELGVNGLENPKEKTA